MPPQVFDDIDMGKSCLRRAVILQSGKTLQATLNQRTKRKKKVFFL